MPNATIMGSMDKKWSTAFQPQTLTMIINANVIQVRIMPFKKLTHFLFIGFPQTPYPEGYSGWSNGT
jgi:hypothetical protein